MNRPYILCNMVQSLDGKSNGGFFKCPSAKKALFKVFEYHEYFLKNGYDGMAMGRGTLQLEFTKNFQPDYSKYKDKDIKCEDFIAKKDFKQFLFAFDSKGVLGWKMASIPAAMTKSKSDVHIVEVLTEQSPKEHLAYFQELGISYIFVGKEEINVNTALEKIKSIFGVEKLILSGGAHLNGTFLREGAVDEISLVIASCTGDEKDNSLFQNTITTEYKLNKAEVFAEDNFVWLDYVKLKKE